MPNSRHAIPTQVEELPYSAAAALAASADFLAVGQQALRPEAETGPDDQPVGLADGGKEITVGDVLHQRINWRQEVLINKGRAEFRAGNCQRAFGQFVLADSVATSSGHGAKRLVVLSCIAAGNYSRGAQELRRLMVEDEDIFTDGSYGVDWLYPDPEEESDTDLERFERRITRLRLRRGQRQGDGSALILYPYALWLSGQHHEAKLAIEEVVEKASDPSLAATAQLMLDRMNGKRAQEPRGLLPWGN